MSGVGQSIESIRFLIRGENSVDLEVEVGDFVMPRVDEKGI